MSESHAYVELTARSQVHKVSRPRSQPRTLSAKQSLSALVAKSEKMQPLQESSEARREKRIRPGVVVIKTFNDSGTPIVEHVIVASTEKEKDKDINSEKTKQQSVKERQKRGEMQVDRSWGERVGWKICKSVKAVGWIGRETSRKSTVGNGSAKPLK